MIVLTLQHLDATAMELSGFRPYADTTVIVPASVCDQFTHAVEMWPMGSEVTIDYGVPGARITGRVKALAWSEG